MDPRLESLFSPAGPKEFTTQFKALRQTYPDIDSFLVELAPALAPRLYEPLYDEVPCGFYGLTCAALAEPLYEDRWRPYAQQLWALRGVRKRPPFSLKAPAAGGDKEQRWADIRAAIVSQDPEKALGLTQALVCEPDGRSFLGPRLAIFALADMALGGHKFNYFTQSWLLAERLAFRQVESLLFGPLHLLAVAARRPELSESADRFANLRIASESVSDLTPEMASEARQAIITGSRDDALDALEQLARRGVRIDRLFWLLVTTAAYVLANAQRGEWLTGVRAFHATFLATHLADWFESQDQMRALALCALQINQASHETRAIEPNPPLNEVIRSFCPTSPFDVLRSVISHSDPFASATAVYAILGMDDEKKEALFRTLAAQAAKNDGQNCRGHDLLIVSQSRDAYQRSAEPDRELFPAVAGFVLGQVPKTYSLAAEYAI